MAVGGTLSMRQMQGLINFNCRILVERSRASIRLFGLLLVVPIRGVIRGGFGG
jgi:hypothetical protein